MSRFGGREGQQLGHYRLIGFLGRGGFAEVYLGVHLDLKIQAALKVLRTSLEDKDVEQFRIESQTLARLRHRQIVRVHDFAVEYGTPFLVMDYAPRGTLRQLHPQGCCLSLDTVVTYVKQIATALQYAHNSNVIHRDVKPENMLLGEKGEVLLSDFGIALFAPSLNKLLATQEMAGTLPYMAPEQLQGRSCFATDQYALGIIVYEWLCGVRPFEGTSWQMMYQHASVLPAPLREKDPSLPQEVENVVLKALAKNPKDRYASIQLFAQALERASQMGTGNRDKGSEGTVTGSLFHIPFSETSRRIFLSSSPADDTFTACLRIDLQRRGITVWNESPSSTLDVHDQDNLLRQAIRAIDVVVLVVSFHTRSSHVIREHLRITSMYQRQLVYVWAQGEDLAMLLPEAGERTALPDVIDAREARYELALDELVARLAGGTDISSEDPLPVELASEPRNPYKGLRSFTGDDAADFFGRETLIEKLVKEAKERLTPVSSARLLAVIGPSGSGKSSVVMAGLLPRLRQNALPGSNEWIYLEPMVPGVYPLEMLALTLAPYLPNRGLSSIHEDLNHDSARGLHLLATYLVKRSEKKVVLIIDQFEEAFNLTTSGDEREQFFDLLLTAITEPKGPIFVILTLRADFYDRLLNFSDLGRLVQEHQLVVWPMEVDELRAAIKGPAALPDVQLTFEGNLVGDLLYEVRGQVGALPLLEFTLDQLFLHRNGHQLTLQAYRQIGGVKGALTKHADDTYAMLPSKEHRELARVLFLRLIDLGTSEQDTTRRRATLSEFSLPDAEQTSIVRETVDTFIAARLLTTNTTADVTTVEVSHEALIQVWPRLAEWLTINRSDILLQGVISTDVAEWLRRNRPADRLYRGSQLVEAQAWAERNKPSRDEIAFLRASEAERKRQETADRERQIREQKLQRQVHAGRISLIAVLTVTVIAILIVGLVIQTLLLNNQNQLLANVTNLSDSGPGSLRDAIQQAKNGETITVAKNLQGTISLTHGILEISKNITLIGPSNKITLDARHMSRIFNVDSGVIAVISNFIIMNGSATNNGNAEGGGIFAGSNSTLVLINSNIIGNTARIDGSGIASYGVLSVSNSIISGNMISNVPSTDQERKAVEGSLGASIYSRGEELFISNSIIKDNRVNGYGVVAGIYSLKSFTLTNSQVLHNTGGGNGGIWTSGETVISNCIISRNKGNRGSGGITSLRRLSVNNSTISDNMGQSTDSPPSSGGIGNAGELDLLNSTISGNSINSNGGGIDNTGSVFMVYTTISNNSAMKGGGIANEEGSSTNNPIYIRTSIIADNQASNSPDIAGFVILTYPNLIENPSGTIISFQQDKSSSLPSIYQPITGRSPQLASLKEDKAYPNAPYTQALLPGSPAINQVPLGSLYCGGQNYPKTDERGVLRPQGSGCDIGAYEYIPSR
jgi:serine/threonine protein kinase